MPTFGAHAPLSYYEIPESDRERRATLGTDDCVIDGELFFVKGSLEIPVHGEVEPFVWSVWLSLSAENFREWVSMFDEDHRSQVGPYFGWLNAWIKPYPDTMNLKTMVHMRDHGVRPFVEIEPTDHLLAVEQRNGISLERVADLYSVMVHDSPPTFGA